MQTGKRRLVFRRVKPEEEALIDKFIRSISYCSLRNITGNSKLYGLYGGSFTEVFALNRGLETFSLLLDKARIHPYSAGFPLGSIRGDMFKPSLPLARKVIDTCGYNQVRNVVLDEKAEKKYLYGRDVLLHINHPPARRIPGEPGFVIVLNGKREVLGWGSIPDVTRGKIKLQNIIDVGWYLRRGG